MNVEKLFTTEPIFETNRLYLRKLASSDAEQFYSFASDPLMTEHVRWDYHRSIEDTFALLNSIEQKFKARQSFNWGIVDKPLGNLIGRVCLFGFDEENDMAEIGFALSREFWNRGIASEASKALIEYGFEEMGLNRIEARCNVANLGSEKVMQKIGMKFEGVLRNQIKMKNEYKSQKLYSILRQEYFDAK
ncbi:GNAT family N-acetyltransferase [Cohnella candidum]|uniref:GNAT family N-acetyltransferase n=1 Tax=Cohnella candidum TaxID=2674991 RepID=UPI0019D2EA7F|nr:GNAT family N-acetyltransferase [Cohnella candidum]